MAESATKGLVDEIRAIKKDLAYIKEHMVDVDMILTPKEEKRLERSLDEYHKGKATKLGNFKR